MALEVVQYIPWRQKRTHILPIQEGGMTSKHMYNILRIGTQTTNSELPIHLQVLVDHCL